ncbi:MAG TPA: endonuclease III [Gammaproteobacteria bacterium]|nr:endonuclease III [Gammaproteobacteria bacterium]
MNKATIDKIFACLKKHNPEPTTELKYHSHFELLIAVILSAQATDVSVNKATAELFKVANTPEQILALGLTKFKSYIKSIGLYNTKAANIFKTCHALIEKHHGHVPKTREELMSLPGVGRKTANVILNTAFGEPTIAVDTHMMRVANRIGLVHSKTPLGVEQQLEAVIPAKYKHDAHHWLILHGRYVCKARKPLCGGCIIQQWCEYPDKNL